MVWCAPKQGSRILILTYVPLRATITPELWSHIFYQGNEVVCNMYINFSMLAEKDIPTRGQLASYFRAAVAEGANPMATRAACKVRSATCLAA